MKKFYLLCFTVALGLTSKSQDLATTMTVSPGTSVSVATGSTVYAANINLKSTSDKYACLLLEGTLGTSTIVNYDRYVNMRDGNDLISMPVKNTEEVTFAEFLNYSPDGGTTKNLDVIRNSDTTPTLFLFGPYDNSARTYVNLDSAVDVAYILKRAEGYRAATDSGQTVRFTGKATSATETIAITTSGNNYWNLIGNPYPTYINSQDFLNENSAVLDPSATAIYGYNSGSGPSSGTIGNFTIINNLTNDSINIAPGQGFLVANDRNSPTNDISFTPSMRTITGVDDFILGRTTNPNQMLRLRAEHATANFATEIYFNDNSTLGLDQGYDAELFSGANSNLMLYSRLVNNDLGRNMAIQSLGFGDLTDVIIPLGLKTAQGSQVTFSIETTTLPTQAQVYLEDTLTNTFTLLNAGDYTFTATTAIAGTGRFFLRIGSGTLSTIEQNSSNLKLYASERTIFIDGQLLAHTKISMYDVLGRLVLTSFLEAGSEDNRIETINLNSGIYVVKLTNEKQALTKKVVIK